MGAWMPLFHAASAYLATVDPHRRNLAFGIAGTVFTLILVGLLGVEGFRLLSRQLERSRQALGERGPGFAAWMDSDFQKPGVRRRLRIMWMIEAGVGLVALIAFFLG